jgi:hypothetical protein
MLPACWMHEKKNSNKKTSFLLFKEGKKFTNINRI